MIDETMKIPEPIIDPATSMVESSKPNPRTNFCSVAAGVVAVVLSIKGLYPVAARVPSRNLRYLANGPRRAVSKQSLGTRELRTVVAASPQQGGRPAPRTYSMSSSRTRFCIRTFSTAFRILSPRPDLLRHRFNQNKG